MARLILLAAMTALVAARLAAEDAAGIAELLRKGELDAAECYRVRDLTFSRGEDLRFYLNEGYLIFGKPIAGRVVSAVFATDVEGGDAELIVMPPSKGERVSLAAFTRSPNLNEHFSAALFLFTDDTAATLHKELTAREARKAPERGEMIARQWGQTVTNLTASFSVRLVEHLLSAVAPERGVFVAAIQGKTLGNIDVQFDPTSPEQIYLGQLKHKDDRVFYDTWTTFAAKSFRTGVRKVAGPGMSLSNYRIEAVLEDDLRLRATTRATLTPSVDGLRVLPFDISQGMRVTAARLNGEPLELFTKESLRQDLIRRNDTTLFLALAQAALEKGRPYEIEFEHEGRIVRQAGRDVYFVQSRANWYPRAGLQFARYDIKFTYPLGLQLVFAGDIKEDTTDGPTRTTRRVTPVPVRLAGFNLGKYETVRAIRSGLTVELFANRRAEPALTARRPDLVLLPPPPSPFPRRQPLGQPRQDVMMIPQPAPDPTARLRSMADEIAVAFESLAAMLGPPALPHLMVSPIPGAFGQGFPGLVYLSTWSYLAPLERPVSARDPQQELFFSELLHAHEVAHQWWGNVVTPATTQDDWIMEALASYSSLMLLEKKKGPAALRSVLEGYRDKLLATDGEGRTVDSAGPIRLGTRLVSSQSPGGWHHITYGKGSWVIHMLRRRMGDARFQQFLNAICQKFRYEAMTLADFRALAATFIPKDSADPKLDDFFEHWVESTGIPELTLATSVKGKAPRIELTLSLTQTGVDENVSLPVPVEVQAGRGKPQIVVLTTGGNVPATATLRVAATPSKVTLDPEMSLLRK